MFSTLAGGKIVQANDTVAAIEKLALPGAKPMKPAPPVIK